MFAIIISEKGGAERKETFDKSEINVGRVQGNDLMLPKGNVSKHHARLLFRDGRFIVTDLKSTNGTYVNGRKIAQATIVREGDKIYIGDFVLRLDSAASAQAPDASEAQSEDASRTLDRGGRFGSPGGAAVQGSPLGSPQPGAPPPPQPPMQAAQSPQGGQAVPAPGRSDPNAVSHYPLERDPDDNDSGPNAASPGGLPRVPAAPRVPQGMQPLPATQTSPPRAPVPGGTMPIAQQPAQAQTNAPPQPVPTKASSLPGPGPGPSVPVRASIPPPGRVAARETPQQAARRLALITLVDRVAEAIDLTPLKVSPLVDEQLSHLIDRTVREQAKVMRDEGEAPEGTDVELLIRDALREFVSLGPVGPLLEDDEVTEIHCVRHDQVLAVRGGTLQLADASFTSEESLGRTIARLAAQTGEPWRPGELVLERRLARGAQMIGIAPPASSSYVLVVRKRRRVDMSLEDFVRAGALSRAMATFVESCLVARANILVCGPTPAGTASFLAALASTGPAGDRVAVVQELEEIGVTAAHVVSLNLSDYRQRGEESVRAAARVRPDRLIIAALAGHVGAAALEAIADGAEGVIAAVHAPSLRQALSKLVAQLVLARPGFNVESARECVGEAFDIAIELGRLPDGRPRVIRLAELGGSDGKGVVARDVFTFVTEGGGAGDGTFAVSGVVPRVVGEFAARGVKVDPNIFKRVGRA
jgi:pilus assembly protein CpaF